MKILKSEVNVFFETCFQNLELLLALSMIDLSSSSIAPRFCKRKQSRNKFDVPIMCSFFNLCGSITIPPQNWKLMNHFKNKQDY